MVLAAFSSTRLIEACRIGYGWHHFPNDYKVADCLHLSWFYEGKSPREKAALRRQLRHLVQWLPLRFSCEPAGIKLLEEGFWRDSWAEEA